MITPNFTVDQDDEFLFIKIKISNIRFSAKSVELVVDENLFIFSLPPYYLRLRFPGLLVEDEKSNSEFDSKEGCINVRISKLNKGENFPDLDLTAKLIARLNEPTTQPSIGSNNNQKVKSIIEEIDSSDNYNESLQKIQQEAENFNWEIEQQLPSLLNATTETAVKYGFNNQYSNMLGPSLLNGNDINELSDPDNLKPDDRIIERLIKENIKFDPEYYANDYLTLKNLPEDFETSGLKSAIEFKSAFKVEFSKFQKKNSNSDEGNIEYNKNVLIEFTKEEHERMKDLPKRSYLVDDPRTIYYAIICIIFGYCYELRTCSGDFNVESAWCIGKLVPQISCLDSQLIQSNNMTEKSMLKVIILTMSRRALSFPLFRNFELVKKSWHDVYFILRCGKRGVLKSLLETRELFRFHDVYYIYCKILLDDLCNWVLRDDGCNEKVLRNLSHALKMEIEALNGKDIVFEKILNEEGQNGEESELEFINLEDIEELADEAYRLSQEN